MTYTVTWSAGATADLVRFGPELGTPPAADREAVWMDTILRRYPNNMGESRWGNHRIWYADVIGVWYVVDDDALTVRILSAGPAGRR